MQIVRPLLLLALCLQLALGDEVLIGTNENFSRLLQENDFVCVMFYAPWCGHCKKLEPEYEKAAAQLKLANPPIALMQVDATEEQNKPLAEKYGVQGFPTLKIFRGGNVEEPQEYKGPRDAEGIVQYLKKKTLPASSHLEKDSEVEAFVQQDTSVVAFLDNLSGPEADAYLAVAGSLADDYSFAHTTLTSLLSKGEKTPTVKIFKQSEGKTATYEGAFEAETLKPWIEDNAVPLLIDLDENPKNREAVQKAFASSRPRFFTIFTKGSAADKDLRPGLNGLAQTLVGEAFFINVDPSNQHALDFFGVKAEETPAFIIQSGKDKYVISNVVSKQLQSFWDDFKAGTLKKTIKSEAPPADNNKPVVVATGNTLEEIVFSGKSVLIQFKASWCGHCKKLEPVYEKVGKHFAKDDSVVIAKMDATTNDISVEQFEVSGFPTIYFVNKTGDVIQYSGDRSEADLIQFVETHSASSQASASSNHVEL